ncbi:MAG: CDGSH iron-sulfur domain-containing protein [Bacteroidales bacterium]|jgi:CDGSH-type Zn-finger protein|nr:CDGSH iron-sulfur domain-containing protein [Bacteroidales bacterium]
MKEKTAQFKVIPNGPLEISGNFEVFDANGEIITRQSPIFLCRCGMSLDKPFCDGAHKKSGFMG